ncbi:MAG: 2-amino-4-hydroxy-6-hydroxymethyldihydropteridine diphosphokinase [Acidobacteria bacterium]|nr:MAG: 2-amino-4-hydroxy-6-hydroxymethyldihydropteridine diphosphokinase [Acidobacteriota bacterium]
MVSRHPGGVKRQGRWVVLGLGANLGDRQAALALARRRLIEEGWRWTLASRVIETAPWGGPPGQPPYLNQVLAAPLGPETLPPRRLLQLCLRIEEEAGRRRTVRWGPRTLDIDLLVYGDRQIDEPGLTVPHPRLAERAFVLVPLAEILPDLPVPPAGRTPAEMLARCRRGDRLPPVRPCP